MAEWLSGDVVANGIRMHYYRTGGGAGSAPAGGGGRGGESGPAPAGGAKPPLVLAHGATDDGLCWTPLARALEGDYDVVMPDARGHGLSEAPEGGYDAATRAADLAALIRALGLERPAVGGHSMGAQTTLYLAAGYPELVRRAILEDPGFWAAGAQPGDAEREARRARMRANMAELKAMSRGALITHGRERNPTWSEEELGPWADAKLRVSPTFTEIMRVPDQPGWAEVLPRVRCPVLLITADPERGSIVTPEVAEEARRLQPALEVQRLRGAGHNVRREQFEPYLQLVRRFLAEA